MEKFLKMIFAVIIVAIAGFGVYTFQKTDIISDLALANVEALAGCESGSSYTGAREYQAENRCICLNCPETSDTNCKCQKGG